MKRPSILTILVIALGVPAAIYYSWLLWNSWTNKAELNAFVKREKIELPAEYVAYLRALDSPGGRKQLSATYDAATKDKSYNPLTWKCFANSQNPSRSSIGDQLTM